MNDRRSIRDRSDELAPFRPGMAYQNMPDVDAPLIRRALSQFSVEVSGDLGLPTRPRGGRPYLGHITAKQAGHLGGPVGGEMVRRMVAQAEKEMADKKPPQ